MKGVRSEDMKRGGVGGGRELGPFNAVSLGVMNIFPYNCSSLTDFDLQRHKKHQVEKICLQGFIHKQPSGAGCTGQWWDDEGRRNGKILKK